MPRTNQQDRIPQPLSQNFRDGPIRMETESQLPLSKVAKVDKELGVERINRTVPYPDRVESLEAIDDLFIQPKAHAQGFDGILFQARVMDASSRRVAGQNAKEKKIQDDNKKNGEKRPADFLPQKTITTQNDSSAAISKEGRRIMPPLFEDLSYFTGSMTASELTSDSSIFALSVIQPVNLSTRYA